jgi:hypothetical protein
MAEEIREALNLLNQKLAGLFPYRLELAAPDELRLLEKNARYMKAEQFQNLVENVKKDGNLSSLPLCYREKDGKLRVLSGNHRVMAARQAGVKQVLVLVIADEKDVDERLAIQLSYNAIAGQNDLVILKELWESIQDVQARMYAGLHAPGRALYLDFPGLRVVDHPLTGVVVLDPHRGDGLKRRPGDLVVHHLGLSVDEPLVPGGEVGARRALPVNLQAVFQLHPRTTPPTRWTSSRTSWARWG